ncbi:MAG: hypothetical protein IKQ08_04670 [Paludibacteraceae bacterium]|nr:hypothetical protein [Paludibacteraceae bacterium]
MNTILWTQNETPLTPSTLIIDGDCSEFEGNKLQNEAMKILSAISNWQTIREENSNLTIQFKKDEGYLISSCFEETDESGRPMVFKFYSKTLDFLVVVEELKEVLNQLDRTYNWSQLDRANCDRIISDIEKHKRKARITKWIEVVVLILISGISFIVSKFK